MSSLLLDACRERLGPPGRRRISFWERMFYVYVPAPVWCHRDDPLSWFFTIQPKVLFEGHVVWGQVLRVDEEMYQPGSENCPGEVVFCPDPDNDVDPEQLDKVGGRLLDLQDSGTPSREQAEVFDHLTAGNRLFGLPVPSSLSPRFPCSISTTYFIRSHLPNGMLANYGIPLLVFERKNMLAAMVVPSKYWPVELVDLWKSEEDLQ